MVSDGREGVRGDMGHEEDEKGGRDEQREHRSMTPRERKGKGWGREITSEKGVSGACGIQTGPFAAH